MKKRNIALCATALLCMQQGYAKTETFVLGSDNTHIENHALVTVSTRATVRR